MADTRPGLAVAASGKSANCVSVSTLMHALLMVFCSLNFELYTVITVTGGRAVYGVRLRPLACLDCGFESRQGHGVLYVVR